MRRRAARAFFETGNHQAEAICGCCHPDPCRVGADAQLIARRDERSACEMAESHTCMAMQIEAPLIGRAGARPAPLTLALEMTCWQGKVGVFSSMVQQGYDSVVTFPTPSLMVLGVYD